MWKLFYLSLFIVAVHGFCDDDSCMHPKFQQSRINGVDGPEEEWEQSYWINNAQKTLQESLEKTKLQKAKNVIFFIGDGMGLPTVTAARILMGQRRNKTGENEKMAFEKFPVSGLIKTYCVDGQVADSACSATAYLGGVKANDGTIGVDAHVKYKDCSAMMNETYHVKSIAHMALDKDKSAGIVTTTRVTHASPAGTYAHTAGRNWENDNKIFENIGADAKCTDIAYQLVNNEPGRRFQVILGGGENEFKLKEAGGNRLKHDLINEWQKDKRDAGKNHKYVTNKAELLQAVDDETDYLLGLFGPSHLEYNMLADKTKQPSLREMTEAAIRTLSRNKNGYFLFVEGGRIDTAHHDAETHMALDETIEFSKAVQRAVDLTDSSETLIIVSADHSHVMTIAGYPSRGHDILAASDGWLDLEGLETLTLTYANGPGYRVPVIINETHTRRQDLAKDPDFINKNPKFKYPALFPHESETHGGEDVGIYASGPWQQLFTGVNEQNVIPHFLAYAMCVGDGETMCDRDNNNNGSGNNNNNNVINIVVNANTSRTNSAPSLVNSNCLIVTSLCLVLKYLYHQ